MLLMTSFESRMWWELDAWLLNAWTRFEGEGEGYSLGKPQARARCHR